MRHYIAVEDERGRWFYANEGRHRETGEYGWVRTGGCGTRRTCPDCEDLLIFSAEQRACQTCSGTGLVDKSDACDGHVSAEEAYEHHKQYLLDNHLRFWGGAEKPRTQYRCEAEGCENFTTGSGQTSWSQSWHLCAEHRTREVVEKLLFVGESWES